MSEAGRNYYSERMAIVRWRKRNPARVHEWDRSYYQRNRVVIAWALRSGKSRNEARRLIAAGLLPNVMPKDVR